MVKSPGQTDSQVDASQRKFAKQELAYRLVMGGQTDCKSASSHKSQKRPKFRTNAEDLRLTCVKSTQVNTSGWPKKRQVVHKPKTSTGLHHLVSLFGQDLNVFGRHFKILTTATYQDRFAHTRNSLTVRRRWEIKWKVWQAQDADQGSEAFETDKLTAMVISRVITEDGFHKFNLNKHKQIICSKV